MPNFFTIVADVLKQDGRFFAEDGSMLRNAIYEAAMQMDGKLIKMLLDDENTKKRFFVEANGVFVFDKIAFGWVVNNRQFMPDSYTRYKNKIGLTDGDDRLLSLSKDVELVFPYKDCVLVGGQTKEEQKRGEVFFNQTLAPDEVDRLLSPKAFTNCKKFSWDGENAVSTFAQENLILRGNNLLALSSLAQRYREKIKCIYIDPPYNTGSDAFHYNDNFNHSSWLTFMLNRIRIAYDLLRRDGAMFVQIDYHELGYLIPLMDEVFGKENCVQIISVKTASPAGFKTVNPGPIDVTEYLLFYTKNRSEYPFKKMYVPTQYDSNYNLYIENPEDPPEEWRLERLYNVIYRENGIAVGKSPQESGKNAKKKWGVHWKTIRHSLMGDFALQNAPRIVSIRDPQKPTKELKQLLERSKKERDLIFPYQKNNSEDFGYVVNGGALSFYSQKVKTIDGVLTPTELLTDMWRDISWDGIANEGGVKLKNGKKPELLLRRIIEMSTEEGDIVLDYHLGSGTACAVAHKLNRRYIGIEQLDYGENDCVARLNNVINGDKTGISKAVDWQGGGSFVYCELAQCNQRFMDAAATAATDGELTSLFRTVVETGFISSNASKQDLLESMDDFTQLNLEEKRKLIWELLDKNMLYVNYCDMEDAAYGLSSEAKSFTRHFYEEA